MEVQINWLAVVLAAASTMVIGSVWYAKPVFGSLWLKLIDKKDKDLNQSLRPIIITVVVSFITAYVLANMTYMAAGFYNLSYFQAALTTAFWVWLGFVAARVITHDVFENRPPKLTLLTVSHELVTLLVMGTIIGLMGAA